MFVRGVLASKKTPCYFCDICGHFEASLGFFFSKVVNLVKFVILALFAIFVNEFVIIVSAIISVATTAKIIC